MNERQLLILAQRAYQAYGSTTEFKNYQGLPMPEFNDLPQKIKDAWVNAAYTVYLESTFNLPQTSDA